MRVTDVDLSEAREALSELAIFFERNPAVRERVLERVAKAIADGREAENKNCEVAVLGDSCDVNSRCGHASCQPRHAHARLIRARRT